jgi:uncharacterized protein (DUF1501 family)
MTRRIHRREFLTAGAHLAAGMTLGIRSVPGAPADNAVKKFEGRANAVIMIYLPGGVAQQDTWDPKAHTPFQRGMRGSELLSTCRTIRTAADPISLGEGMEQIAAFMDHTALIRSLRTRARFGASHVKAQFYAMTGYLEPVGLKPPSIGSVVARSLGPRNPNVPPYIYIGADANPGSNVDKQKAAEFTGPGFYGSDYAPFRVTDPARGLETLNALAAIGERRLDRRLEYLAALSRAAGQDGATAAHYLKVIGDARRMMDSPVKKAFAWAKEESAQTIKAYEPVVPSAALRDKSYDYYSRFGHSLLLARRLVEAGARFVQVELQYDPFKGFDMHEDGAARMVEMKKQIDGPMAQLLRDLKQRGLLDRTLVVIESEFGRTIASDPAQQIDGKAGTEAIGATEEHDGTKLTIDSEKMYGLHGHFSTNHTVVLLGGAVRGGTVYGKTADRHPMLPVENQVELPDIHATIFKALGIPADHSYITEGRPFYVTKDGKGRAIDVVLA